MALPVGYTYRYGVPQADFEDISSRQQQLVLSSARGANNAQLAAPYGGYGYGAGGSMLQHGRGAANEAGSGTPNIYIQPGATVNATIHQHFYPPSSSGSAFDTIAQPPFHAHHPHQCRLCDHTFPSPTLLTDHKLLNRHHCPCCRQCFADWETHLLRSPHMLCPIDGCGRSFATDDMFKEHFWSMHYYYFSYGGGADGGGRRGGTTVETRAIEYDPDWIGVIEEEESRTRRSRSRTRRRRSRVRRRSSRHFLYY